MKSFNKEDLVLKTEFKITSAETDLEGRIRLGSLVNLLIQSATQSADKLGFGFDNLKKHNLFWVFSRLTVNISRALHWNETVEVETWPKDIVGLLYTRDFIIRDEKGEIVSRATSAWLPIDLETKRPKRKESFETDFFTFFKDKFAIREPPEKLPEISGEDTFEINPTYFDIDFNKHVTSTRYIDWIMDTFPLDFHRKNFPKKLLINYLKETLPGDKTTISRSRSEEKEYSFSGLNLNNSRNSFRAKIGF